MHDSDRSRHENGGDERGRSGPRTTRRSVLKTAGAAATAVGVGAVGTAAGGIPTPRLHTDGKWIQDPSGNRVKLRGVATADPGFYARSWHPQDPVEVAERAADENRGWHSNHIRIPCTQSSVDHHGGIDAFVEDILRPVVDALATKNVYALVDFHLIRPYTDEATETYNSENDPDYAMPDEVLTSFWSRVAPEFADDEHVIYELFNEPTLPAHYGNDEQAWKTWREAAQPWVDLVQEHAPATPLVIGSPRWTSVTHMAPQFPFDGDNLIYAGHIYPANGYPNSTGPDGNGPFDPTYGDPATEVPVWITEFGWDPEGGDIDRGENSGFGTKFREWVESYENVGWSAWCFDDTWAPTMFSSPGDGSAEPWTLKDGSEQHGGFIKEWLAETKDDMIPESPIDDSQAPPTPTGLAVEDATEISVTVSWNGVSDVGEAGLSHYDVTLDGEHATQVTAGTTRGRVTGLSPSSSYEVSVSAVDEVGNESNVATTNAQTIARDADQSAYAEHVLPARIRAENFDTGGRGVAYYDTSERNQAGGDYRDTTVDIGTSDADGYNVGYITAGEWIEYTVEVEQAGEFEATVSWASGASNGGTVAIEVDGERMGERDLWQTGGWATWQQAAVGTGTLSAGTHVVRVVAETSGWNFDWVEFSRTGSGNDDTTPPTVPSNLTVADATVSAVTVSWDASSDSGTGVDHYEVAADAGETTVPAGTTAGTLDGLSAGTSYDVSVRAVDGAGNRSSAATVAAETDGDGPDLDPVDGTVPQDIDGDGEHEDFNANGEVDFDDVVAYFDHMDESVMTDHVAAYDYNGNEEIDFADVVSLFQEVS